MNATSNLSRRQLLAAAAISLLEAPAMAQRSRPSERSDPPSLQLAAEFKAAHLLATASNGKAACLCFTRSPQRTFIQGGPAPKDMGSELRLIEMGSWKAIRAIQLHEVATEGSFFSDSGNLYAHTSDFWYKGVPSSQHVVIGPKGDMLMERILPDDRSAPRSTSYWAIRDQALLGAERNNRDYRIEALVLAVLPDFKVTARSMPFSQEPDPFADLLAFPADHTTVVYAAGRTIFLRRTIDLSTAWTRETPPGLFGTRRVSISADGSSVAAAILDTTFSEAQKNCYVEILSAARGEVIASLPLNGDEGVALSPDASRLAVASRVPVAGSGEFDLKVDIYELPSGRRTAGALHDRVPKGRFQNLNGVFDIHGLEFTSDGHYLLSSGNHKTKIWKV